MSLGAPWMLLLLPLVGLAGWLTARGRRLQGEAACRLRGVVAEDHPAFLTRRDWLVLAALACVILALARPRWDPRPYEVERRGRDVVIALDVSRSMLAADIFPNRLEMARIAIHESLPAFSGQRLALVTFAGSASVRVPLTLDHGFVRYMLDRADPTDMDTGSTSLQAAVDKVADTVLTDAAGGRRDLLVFTDGEDHLSDLERTAETLAGCKARVLLIGLGDPARGARVPDAVDDDRWMRHNGVEVVSRLDESTLQQLADKAANVTYYPARTSPFDVAAVYRRMIAGAADGAVVGGTRQVRYTEGYPYLLAVSIALWLAASPLRLSGIRSLLVLVVLLPGCGPRAERDGQAAFQARFERGRELLGLAGDQAEADPLAERSLLLDAREEFLRAALLKPGDIPTARRITTLTRRLQELERAIQEQRAEERQRGEKLADMVRRVQAQAVRQERLAQRSRRILRRRPVLSEEEYNLPEPPDRSAQLPPQEELERLAPSFLTEQQAVREETASVLAGLQVQQETLRELLTRAYGDIGRLPATEVDPVAELLAASVSEQDRALANLAPGQVHWPRANTAFHTAAGSLRQSLEGLRSLQPPATDEADESPASRNAGGSDDELEGPDSEPQESQAAPVSPGDFREALSLRTLPVPDYSPAEILAEEAANQQKRARRKAARAGARVERNW